MVVLLLLLVREQNSICLIYYSCKANNHLTEGATNTTENDLSNSEPPPSFGTRLKHILKNSLWNFLSYAPIFLAFNIIIDTHKDSYLIWDNLFGYVLFLLVVMGVCLIVWAFLYGVFVLPLTKWLFPRWYEEETESSGGSGDEEDGRL
jgi:hypothetical protein